ncbi:MAG TPA: hypothetical protein VK631_20400, partial [Solirubrobacteraceae bacterium]|nr:hypothetical protein [Solirubrobacteraceae bacterium]
KTDTLIEKTAEIHTLTNSANADLKAQLELIQQRYEAQLTLMQQRYDAQSEVIRQMLATAADQAATRVLTDQRIAAALATPAPATTAEQNLAQIEVNTADTAALLRPKTP